VLIPWPFTGREPDRDQLRGLLISGRSAVVAGPAGVGKSRLVEEVLASLVGVDVQRLAGTVAAGSVPLGAFARLLPARAPRANLLGWARAAIVDNAKPGLLLAIDDLQLLDQTSAALVHGLLLDGSAQVVGTLRTGPVQTGEPVLDTVTALWKDGLVDRVELAALSAEQVRDLAEAVLTGPLDHHSAQRLWQLSQGVPLLLRELVIGALAEGILREQDGVWQWHGPVPANPRLRELIDRRLAGLDAAEHLALELVALGEPLDVEALVMLAGQAAAESLEERALIRVRQDNRRMYASPAHPLYGELVAELVPELCRRSHYRRLADAVESSGPRPGDAVRVTLWRLDAGVDQPQQTLMAAFQLAWAAQDGILAERLARAALAAAGGPAAAAALVEVLTFAERFTESGQVIRTVWEEPMEDQLRAQLTMRLAWVMAYEEDLPEDAAALLDRVEVTLTDPVAKRIVALQKIGLLCDRGEHRAAAEICRRLLDDPDLDVDDRADPLSTLAICQAMTGHTAAAQEAAAHCLAEYDHWRESAPFVAWQIGYAQSRAGQFGGDLDAADAGLARQRGEKGQDLSFVRLHLQREEAMVLRMRGRVAAGLVAALRGPSPTSMMGSAVYAEAAHCAALLGDLSRARALREQAMQRTPWLNRRLHIDFADVWLAAQAGLISEAIRRCLELAAAAERLGLLGVEMLALHDLVRLDAAELASARLAVIATHHDGHLAPVVAAHALAAAKADPGGLAVVASRFEELGMVLHAAEAAAQAATVFGQVGQARAATAATGRALRLAERCEGARTPALIGMRTPHLSRREYEIARLAARGLSNKEIATQLFLALRTVENHLHTVFTKLGITRRDQLHDLVR
jgi:DNA-binding CsgD family transcriptional regulator